MAKKAIKRILTLFLTLLLCIMTVWGGQGNLSAFAAESVIAFEDTNVLDDLKSIKGFDIMQYPFYSSQKPEMIVIDVLEYCYDFHAENRQNYGLYLYVYNPNGQEIATGSDKNIVRIATKYNKTPVTDASEPTDYEDFKLRFCSVSEEPGTVRLFYKFKVIDHIGEDGKLLVERVNSHERRYDISGIELHTKGNPLATAYTVGSSYRFSGYAKGCGDGESDEVSLRRETLEVVELDLNSTTYRFPWINEHGAGHQNQLDSVYFAVPKGFQEKYGNLYKVKCRWDERKTAPVLVTNKDNYYSMFSRWVGEQKNITDRFAVYSDYRGNGNSTGTGGKPVSEWGWGSYWNYNGQNDGSNGGSVDIGGVECNTYDPVGYVFRSNSSNVKDTEISSQTMLDWIYSHDYADYLFSGTVDAGRTAGEQVHEFCADEPFNLLSFNSQASGWNKFCLNWQKFWTGTSWDFGPSEGFSVDPFVHIGDKHFTGTDKADAENLYVGSSDFADFKAFYQANKAEKDVFLFRFAVTDYYSKMMTVVTPGQWWPPSNWNGVENYDSTYMARETVFLNFNIITLTFKRDTTETIIPVVASPIDVVGGITSPISKDGIVWWKIVLALLLLVLFLYLLAPILPYILRAIIWIVTLPFKAIGALCKSAREKRKRRKAQAESPPQEKVKCKAKGKVRDLDHMTREEIERELDAIDWDSDFWKSLDSYTGD